MTKERQIIMSSEMVKAIIEGRKTMTRRIVKPQPELLENNWLNWSHNRCWAQTTVEDFGKDPLSAVLDCCHYGKPGDVLYVKETYQYTDSSINEQPGYVYKATDPDWDTMEGWKWKPSIFMPKEAARIWLEITDIKIERLQDISEEDAIAEGVNKLGHGLSTEVCGMSYKAGFRDLWQKINGDDSWEQNLFVWVISFKILSATGKLKYHFDTK